MSILGCESQMYSKLYWNDLISKRELLTFLSTVNLGTKTDSAGRSVLYLLLR